MVQKAAQTIASNSLQVDGLCPSST